MPGGVRLGLRTVRGIPPGAMLPGIVLQNTPDKGRISRGVAKVWLPFVHGEEQPDPSMLPEAIVAMPWGGISDTGLILMPPINASVICGFILGDIERPVILGSYFGEEGLPSDAPTDEPESAVTLQHPDGFLVKIDFAAKKLEIVHPSGHTVTLDDTGLVVEHSSKVKVTVEKDTVVVEDVMQNKLEFTKDGCLVTKLGITPNARVVTELFVCPFLGAPLSSISAVGISSACKVSNIP
jgi:phage baseplate assembly protein gpV